MKNLMSFLSGQFEKTHMFKVFQSLKLLIKKKDRSHAKNEDLRGGRKDPFSF